MTFLRLSEEIQTERHRANQFDQRVREIEQQLAASQVRERAAEVRVQEAQQLAQQRVEEIEQATEEQLHQAEERVQAAQRRSHDLQQRAHDTEQRARDAEQRVRDIRQELAASQERERAAEVRVQEAQQQAQQRVEQIEQATEEQLHQAEERAQTAERRSHDLQQRTHEAEQRSYDLQQRVHTAEQHTIAVERHLHDIEQRSRESERRARQAEAVVQQSQQESHWLVQQREIELTEEERGRGGWAVVKVANFRGTRVAAKCFYQQILVSRYNRQLFNREMNMAARLRHPNLIQFIGASLEGEPIILTELMTTSLRAELEKGPIEHAHITSISLDVARGLNYLHLMQPHPIIHRDISSANVLLDPLPGNRWKAKISDYGSVNLLRELRTVGPGSPVYAAPEASIPTEQSPKMDIFSFGVLLVEMLTDEFPTEDARQRLLDSVNHAAFVDLIRRCLREEREERPSANEIITNISDM